MEEKSNIIYSRIRLARNWDEYVFPSRLDEEGSRELVDGLKDGLKEIPYPYYALENMQQAEKKALRERRILNRCAVEKHTHRDCTCQKTSQKVFYWEQMTI